MDRISNEWMKLGTRGVTVLFASGDDGVGCNDDCDGFEFPYPSSPWITLVGSTQLDAVSRTNILSGYNFRQVGSNDYTETGSYFSSGGFSNDFGTPTWQKAAVDYYLQNCPNLPPSSYYNASGRALPDISAAGENVQIIVSGSQTPGNPLGLETNI